MDANKGIAVFARQIGPSTPVETVQLSEDESAVLAQVITRQLNPLATCPTVTHDTFVRAEGLLM